MINTSSKNLPLAYDSSSFFLPWMVMLMVFFATITTSFSLSINAVLDNLEKSISGSLTVQIVPKPNMSKVKISSETDTTIRVLKETAGVVDAKALSLVQMKDLLRPWFGNNEILDDLPMPIMIDVTLDESTPLDLVKLREDLELKSPLASIDVHYLWLSKLISFSKSIKFLSFLIMMLVISSTAITVIYAASSSLDVQRETIWLLHLIGAKDHYISKHFSIRIGVLSLIGALIGTIIAYGMIYLVGSLLNNVEGGVLSSAKLDLNSHIIVLFIPISAMVLSTITSYLTVWQRLKRML